MKSIAAILACCFGTASRSCSALSLPPPPRLAPCPHQRSATRLRTSLTFPSAAATDLGARPLHMAGGADGDGEGRPSVFRRAKNRLRTLVVGPKADAKKQKEPEQMWTVMFHNTEYLPGYVCKALAKVVPISKKAAYEICLRAREEGVVPLTVCNKKQAERYCGAILRQGLTATIEPLEFE